MGNTCMENRLPAAQPRQQSAEAGHWQADTGQRTKKPGGNADLITLNTSSSVTGPGQTATPFPWLHSPGDGPSPSPTPQLRPHHHLSTNA